MAQATFDAAAIWPRPWEGLPASGGRIVVKQGHISSVEDGAASGDLLWFPGLINAHDHGRGLSPLAYGASDAPLEPWLWDLRRAPGVDVYLSHVVAFGEMALSGISTVIHNHLPQGKDLVAEAREVAQAARDVGLRLGFVVPIIDRNLAGYDGGAAALAPLTGDERAAVETTHAMPPVAEQIALVREIAIAIDGSGTVTQYGPPGPQWLSREGWAMVGAAAAEDGRRVHTHLLETLPQRHWLDTEEPGGADAFLTAAGVLCDRLTIAHGVHLTAREMVALADAGAVLALNTSSNMRLRSGQVDGALMAQSGLTLGIGLDGLALDDDADIWRELRLAQTLLGPRGVDGGGLQQRAILRAAFATGARALDGKDAPGLVHGAPADMVALSLDRLAHDRVEDSAATLAALALGRSTRHTVARVVSGGCEIVRDGELTGLDLSAARRELAAQARAARAASPPGDWIARARAATIRHYGGTS
ncbi:amidohydrolase family protein [uncultured Marivita sp.]|uniref:amidohydrolase family protein n=1 Tax=uncultured Marivita sp. TaxID=888080 RepID=UPI0026343B9F|nr:amidohydrolase family protein [uncultured Marivita sp.]